MIAQTCRLHKCWKFTHTKPIVEKRTSRKTALVKPVGISDRGLDVMNRCLRVGIEVRIGQIGE
jgi:hypothetical protein